MCEYVHSINPHSPCSSSRLSRPSSPSGGPPAHPLDYYISESLVPITGISSEDIISLHSLGICLYKINKDFFRIVSISPENQIHFELLKHDVYCVKLKRGTLVQCLVSKSGIKYSEVHI